MKSFIFLSNWSNLILVRRPRVCRGIYAVEGNSDTLLPAPSPLLLFFLLSSLDHFGGGTLLWFLRNICGDFERRVPLMAMLSYTGFESLLQMENCLPKDWKRILSLFCPPFLCYQAHREREITLGSLISDKLIASFLSPQVELQEVFKALGPHYGQMWQNIRFLKGTESFGLFPIKYPPAYISLDVKTRLNM